MIYVLKTEGADFYKIGYTAGNLAGRIDTLQCGCPYYLALVALDVTGTLKEETSLHSHMMCFGFVRGEWFKANHVLYEFIAAHPLPPPKDDDQWKPTQRQHVIRHIPTGLYYFDGETNGAPCRKPIGVTNYVAAVILLGMRTYQLGSIPDVFPQMRVKRSVVDAYGTASEPKGKGAR